MKNSLLLASLVAIGTLSVTISAFGAKCPEMPFEEYDQMIRNMYPPPPNMGINASYRYASFLGFSSLSNLKQYEGCMPEEEFAQKYITFKNIRDSALEGCRKTSNDGGTSCTASMPK